MTRSGVPVARRGLPRQARLNQRRKNGRPRRYFRKKAPKGTPKYQKRKQKKATAYSKLSPQQKMAVSNAKKGTTYMLECSPIGVQTTSLKSLYRVIHAIVACYYPKINVESVGDPVNSPQLGPGGLAAWLAWCVVTAIRKNSSTSDLVPDPNTLPDFNFAFKIPIPLAVFIIAWLRNKGPTFDIYNELPDVSNLIGATTPNNITFNAATYTLTTGPYGDIVQPIDAGSASEFMFNSATATTFTRAQLIASADIWNTLVSNVGGCVAFERLWRDENGASRIVPYASPVLLANPVTDGFDCRMKFQHEIAALIIDYSAPTTASDGIVLRPYPMANQDKYVLGVVNLLSHCKTPVNTYRKKDWIFPPDVRRIIDPTRSNHRWHSYGRIKTLVVNMTNNTTNWYSVHKNICEQLCVAYSGTALTNTSALEANEMSFIMQAYIFSHLLDWGWQHYTRLTKLLAGQFLNSVTSGSGPDIKSIPVPQNIAELVRHWRPIVVAGQLTIPDCPPVAISTLANFLSFGTSGVTFTGTNITTFQTTASPNGYNGPTPFLGLYTTTLAPSAPFTAAAYSLRGNTMSNTNFGGAPVSATLQSPSLPIKLANLFIADWKGKFIAISNQKMFNMEYPILGDIGTISYVDVYFRLNWLFGSGWTSTRLDYTTGQILIATDRVLSWKGIQYARIVNATTAIVGSSDYYAFKITIASGDGGVLANVEAFAKDDLGQEYNAILTGLESNPKLTDRAMKPWLALDNITSRLYDERGGAAFEEFSTEDAIVAFMVSLKNQGVHMASYSYSENNNLFQPNSLSGWMSFLSGVTATYNTGKFIFTDIYNTFNKLFGLSKVTLI